MSVADQDDRSGFDHLAVAYDSEVELCGRLARFLQGPAAVYDHIVVVVTPPTEQAMRRMLPAELVGRAQWGMPDLSYAHLGRFYEGLRRFFAAPADGHGTTLVVGEFGYDGVAERISQYLRYEAMCNTAFAPYRFAMLCLCDTRRFPAEALARFRTVHPRSLERDGPALTPGYLPSAAYLDQDHQDEPEPPADSVDLRLELSRLEDLSRLRRTVLAWSPIGELDEEYAQHVVVAVNEIVTNGLVHGEPPVQVRGWHAAPALVVQVDDRGGVPIPAILGYVRPDVTARGGRGLWLARHIADVLTIRHGDGGNSVRMSFVQP